MQLYSYYNGTRGAFNDQKNNSIIDLLLIEALLKSNISTYKISKATQIPNSTISNLRNGKRELKNITSKNGLKLSNYARKQVSLLINSKKE